MDNGYCAKFFGGYFDHDSYARHHADSDEPGSMKLAGSSDVAHETLANIRTSQVDEGDGNMVRDRSRQARASNPYGMDLSRGSPHFNERAQFLDSIVAPATSEDIVRQVPGTVTMQYSP
jgi:hypothetical protein